VAVINVQGMNTKKDLLEKCKSLVDQVKLSEHNMSQQLRKVSKDVSEQLEVERKKFRAGQEARQRKFLAERLRECEDATLRALEPEFSRLRISAEQDLADLSAKLTEDTRRMKTELKKLFETKLAAEEKHHRESQRMLARVRLDEAVQEADQLERDHKRKLGVMTEDLSKALDTFRRNISQKVKHEREDSASELQEREKKYLDRMSNLRSRHEDDVKLLQMEHSSKIHDLRNSLERKKEDYLDKHEGHMSPDGDNQYLNAAEEDAIENLKKDLAKKRDSHLKAEIRRIQTESALGEKDCRSRLAEERRRVEGAMVVEEEQLRRKQSTYTDQIAELSVQKNQLSNEINSVLDELTSLQDELSAVKLKYREAEGIQYKVKQKRKEIEDNHEQQKERLLVTEKAKLQDLWNKINELNLSMSKNAKNHEAELQQLDAKHQSSLNELNAEIKSDVLRKDDELDCLRDAVHTEKVKMDRVRKLLAKYM